MSRDEREFVALRLVCADVTLMQEGNVSYLYLRQLRANIAGAVLTLDALLCLERANWGYPTKLFLSQSVSDLVGKRPGKPALNWNQQPMLFGRQWHTWSWDQVPAELPLIDILMGHLGALQ